MGSTKDCLISILQLAAALPGGTPGVDTLCLSDAAIVLQGQAAYILRALGEVKAILDSSVALASGSREKSKPNVNRIRRGVKKLDFLLSFAFHHDDVFTLPVM